MKMIFRRFHVKTILGLILLGLFVTSYGQATAVNIVQASQSVLGLRVTTAPSAALTVVSNGVNVATAGQAGAAATTITPNSTNPATATVRVGTLAAGNYLYSITVNSSAPGNSIPAGTLNIRWTINNVEQTMSIPITAAAVTAGNTGGFTLLVAGDAANTPENIQMVIG